MSPSVKRELANIVHWGHDLLAEVLEPGVLVVDLTAGNGQDTLALWKLVGREGQVIACDLQRQALENTAQRLNAVDAAWRYAPADIRLAGQPGIDLVQMCHSRIAEIISGKPRAVIANLGYLPGGDQNLITRPETTGAALSQSCKLLASGGRIAVVVYPGHPGGDMEAEYVQDFFRNLDSRQFTVLELKLSNRVTAPFLLVAEKREN